MELVYNQNYGRKKSSLKCTFDCTTPAKFLDLEIFHIKGKIICKTFDKDNNLHLYVAFQSLHPQSNKKGLIVGQLIRLSRLNTKYADFYTHANDFFNHLLARGYTSQIINDAISSFNLITNGHTSKSNNNNLICHIPFHPLVDKAFISHLWDIKTLNKYLTLFCCKPTRVMISFFNEKNLQQLLIKNNSN